MTTVAGVGSVTSVSATPLLQPVSRMQSASVKKKCFIGTVSIFWMKYYPKISISANKAGPINRTKSPAFANRIRRRAMDAATVKAVKAGIHRAI